MNTSIHRINTKNRNEGRRQRGKNDDTGNEFLVNRGQMGIWETSGGPVQPVDQCAKKTCVIMLAGCGWKKIF